jgi:hypothetical protein
MICPLVAGAQTGSTAVPLAAGRSALVKSTEEYKASTEELLRFDENEMKKAAAAVEQLRQLFAEGLIARRELEESEKVLAAAKATLDIRHSQISSSEQMIARVKSAEELAKSRPLVSPLMKNGSPGSYSSTAVLMRYNGTAQWSIAMLSGIQAFFASTFGRSLPTSAVGQTATHDRLGFDHRNAVDVALHPDSPEGRALINYLQSKGIAFLAFRAAVPGAATGPHIHIGAPSHKIG